MKLLSIIALVALVISFIAIIMIVEMLLRRHRLKRQVEDAWLSVPIDIETGLFDRSVCLQRISVELKRARRSKTNVWVGVVTVASGDADRFGRLLQDTLRVPEVAFRLSEQVVCIVRPNLAETEYEELVGRIIASGPREQIVLGDCLWESSKEGSAADLLRNATDKMVEVGM